MNTLYVLLLATTLLVSNTVSASVICEYDTFKVTVTNVTSNGFDIQSTDPKAHCVGVNE